MEYNHTIKEIAARVGKTPQSIQKLRSKNLSFFEAHTKTRGRAIFFDDEALGWFMDYYRITPNDTQEQPEPTEEQPQDNAETTFEDAETTETAQDDTPKTTNDTQEQPHETAREALLAARVAELEAELRRMRAELDEQRQIHKGLLLTLAGEQENVRRMIDAHKPFLARLKDFFTRNKKPALLLPSTQPQEAPGEAAEPEAGETT